MAQHRTILKPFLFPLIQNEEEYVIKNVFSYIYDDLYQKIFMSFSSTLEVGITWYWSCITQCSICNMLMYSLICSIWYHIWYQCPAYFPSDLLPCYFIQIVEIRTAHSLIIIMSLKFDIKLTLTKCPSLLYFAVQLWNMQQHERKCGCRIEPSTS